MVTSRFKNATAQSLATLVANVLFLHDSKMNAYARTWDTIVDVSIFSAAMIDPHRDAGKIFSSNSTATENEWTTRSPTVSPTSFPMSSIVDTTPTALPSMAFSCPSESNDTIEFESVIKMYDSWGDGWGDTKMIISQPGKFDVMFHLKNTVFDSFADLATVSTGETDIVYEGTLVDGNEDYINLCFQSNICYTVEVNGTTSEWQNEIQWDIRQKNEINDTLNTLAKGFAPMKCQFSIPDAVNGSYVCEFSCNNSDDDALVSVSPSFSSVPSDTPSYQESNIGSDFPSTISSVIPSYTPSAIPTSPSSGGSAIIDTPVSIPDEKSLRPSMASTTMETATILPTVTFQPTTTMYPTSYMSGGNVIVAVGGGSSKDADTEFADDDTFLHNPAPVHVPTASRSSEQGDISTIYPTVTAHPTAYGADFMNSIVHESSVVDFSYMEETTASDGDDAASGKTRVSPRSSNFGSATIFDETGTATVDDDTAPLLTISSSASLENDNSASVDDDTAEAFGSAKIDDAATYSSWSSASVDDDTAETFGSAKVDDDTTFSSTLHNNPQSDAGEWFETIVLRPPRRSPHSAPTRDGKSVFQNVFSPSFTKPNPPTALTPTQNKFYQFIYGFRSPTKPIVSPTRPIFSPTRPIVSPTKFVFSPMRPIIPPTRPILSPTRPVSAPSRPQVTPTSSSNPVAVPVPLRPIAAPAPRRPPVAVPTPTKPNSPSSQTESTFAPTTTFQPTRTYYPTITFQPTTTFYPTITAYPTVKV